jgi:small conductance mechanosensitive channel
MEPGRVAASAARVLLQTGLQNGTDTANATNRTNASNATAETVRTATRLLPKWIPVEAIRLALAVLVLVGAWYGSNLLVRLLSRRVARRFRRPSVTRAVLRSVRISVMFFAVLTALAFVGVRLGDLLLSVTVLAAAVGVVLAPIIGNVISGLFVLADQPYEVGDMVALPESDQKGFIEDVTFRYTKISTTNNAIFLIPNETIRERDVVNYTAEDRRTRLTLDLLVTYEGDLAEARALCERAAREVDGVISGGPAIRIGSARYPAEPTCYINTFAEHGVLLSLRYWAKEPYNALHPPFSIPSAILENIWDELDGADVEMAYPHSHLVFDETSGDLSVSFDEGEESPDDHHRRVS